ncbi:MAG: DUF1232 domain-containing protein [Planctomycetes bacterium]|nr:DUF1232 domain-containing protein [Planctomycetota bacterium]
MKYTTNHKGREFSGEYSDSSFMAKVRKHGAKIGRVLINQAFILYYQLRSPNCPTKDRAIILGALAYLILPIDLIPDFIPVVGFGDDALVIGKAVAAVNKNVDASVTGAANEATDKLLG